ncbi:MAG TPA: hypothetical protein VFL95_07015, partial [Gemmatimonadales bacterium]|nr:hypothetical protein [Gemmatimonadales bacterium]
PAGRSTFPQTVHAEDLNRRRSPPYEFAGRVLMARPDYLAPCHIARLLPPVSPVGIARRFA